MSARRSPGRRRGRAEARLETQIQHQQNNIKKLEHTVETLKSVILQTEDEISQGKSPSRLDTFIKTLEEDRDYYKGKTENLLRVFRSASSSPKCSSSRGSMSKETPHTQGLSSDPDVLINLRELESTLKKYRHHLAEIQDTSKVLAAERDRIASFYEQISQETAFNEKAHLQQRIEELETTIQNLDSERLEQMFRVALMKEHINSLETELSHQKTEYISLSLKNEKTEQILSEAERSLVKKKYEMELNEEKIRLLNEKIDDFSKQSFAQEEKICALKETIVQLGKEKKTLQECVEEEREKTATSEENLKIKEKTISDLKILMSDLERSKQKSAEALCICEKDINSLRQQLQETNKELTQTKKDRESLAQEKDRLQEHLSNTKHENQVLHMKITKYQNDMKLKAQDSNTDIVRLKGVLKSKERENCELLENYHKACEQRESWEAKCHQAEADCNSVRFALKSVESENRRLKEKMKTLETGMERHLTIEEAYQSQLSTLRKSFVKMEGELQNIHQERVSILANITSVQELCLKLDAGKEVLSQQLTSTSEKAERVCEIN
ncbi:testis-specific gene 10 protein isoform X4 [Numida meleagris]|uniref:testis-specific gene 10 protein isoform X4 n=1 Tax=Numida meleagris TaxID=8996 RepID=UPI000B3DA756|nr:testis-specific gene 10 protein isoform X4 [Numida meleagris]